MQKTLEMIKRRPEIKEKFYFIQHFKMLDQFEIWNQLEEELNINDHIIHRSIGGLVGLKKMVRHFQRTTFLPMIFKSFFNFIEVYKKDHEEPYLGGFEQVFDKFSWRQPLKDLFNAVDKLTSYSDLKLLKRFAECEGLINGSGLKSLVKDSSLDHLTEKLKEILDIYFDQLQSSPQTNKNQLFEHIIDKVLGEDSSDRKKDQIDAFASEKREFRLHVLGVSNMQDRYMITLVEKLLNNHCLNEGLKVEINITYDSIFYTTQAQKNFRNLNYFRRDGTKRTLTEIDEEDLKLVYPDKYELVKQEIKSDRLLDADTFTPLNINSNILIDQYFKEMMDERSLPSSFVKTLDKYYEGRKVVEELGEILDGEAQFLLSLAENPAEVVMNKKRLAEKLNDDLCTIVHFYLLIKRKEGLNAINAAVKDHINAIDYPFQLK